MNAYDEIKIDYGIDDLIDIHEFHNKTQHSEIGIIMNEQFKGQYCMIRTYSAGVFAGTIDKREGKEALLSNARRIWYWEGAASLSQLATDGTSKPNSCKFPAPVESVLLTEVIEIIPITEKAKESINEVPIWEE